MPNLLKKSYSLQRAPETPEIRVQRATRPESTQHPLPGYSAAASWLHSCTHRKHQELPSLWQVRPGKLRVSGLHVCFHKLGSASLNLGECLHMRRRGWCPLTLGSPYPAMWRLASGLAHTTWGSDCTHAQLPPMPSTRRSSRRTR